MPTGIYLRTKEMKTGKHMLGRKLSIKTRRKMRKWAVIQRGFHYNDDDVFDTKIEAQQYKRDCFNPEHKARIIKIEV